jgi:hypothetical protein
MERLIPTVEDECLRELLRAAIDGCGAFRRFENVLYTPTTISDSVILITI